ncbi:MAG TPA: thiamine pyrophosphate-dependent enzyme [Thermoanaerobaculaceae bacterium]|nr:thiamine pyrophosphate-dependent enzyme [Thermoanaerobaculaceae bacterium]
MTRAEAVALALSMLGDDDIAVAADGAISREAYNARDRRRTFYMLGSMGQVASIALGLAMTRRERVVALDGDGNLLMGFGALALVGGLKPANLHHLVLDNGCYATTGGQPALSRQVDLAAAAAGAGYPWTRRCARDADARADLGDWIAAPGPALLDLVVDAADPAPAPRVPMTPEEMAERVRAALAAG